MNPVPILRFQHVSKIYPRPEGKDLVALTDVSFEILRGRTVSIVGRSGSGKSTLLHLAAGIDVPSGGAVFLDGTNLAELSERNRTILRRDRIGLVFQFFHLLPHLSVWDNIALPELIAGTSWKGYEDRLEGLLSRVCLLDRAAESIEKLSGGEMQRVAICRALLRKPALLLADEPTGNLDDASARSVLEMMLTLVKEEKSTLVFVTHSREMAALADETWSLHSGLLERAPN